MDQSERAEYERKFTELDPKLQQAIVFKSYYDKAVMRVARSGGDAVPVEEIERMIGWARQKWDVTTLEDGLVQKATAESLDYEEKLFGNAQTQPSWVSHESQNNISSQKASNTAFKKASKKAFDAAFEETYANHVETAMSSFLTR